MLEFIDSIISEPLRNLYQRQKDKTILWEKLKNDLKSYIETLAEELDEFNIHRSNNLIRLSKIFVEPRLIDRIVSEAYVFHYSQELRHPLKIESRNPKVTVHAEYVTEDNYKSINQLLEKYKKIIILGQPGNGKTTILKKIILDIANIKGVKAIPIYIPLRNCTMQNLSVFEFVCQQFKNHGIESAELISSRLLEHGKLIILFDGIDEIIPSERQRVLEEINLVSTKYPNNTFVSTSRISSYNGELTKYKEVEICDFQPKDIVIYVDKWFEDDNKKNGLLEKIKNYPQILEIASNPLLLSLICIVYDFDLEITSRRTTLYKRCIECLMRDWDAQRGFRRVGKFIKLDDLKRISILGHLAYNLHLNNQIYFKLETIDTFLADIIQRYGLCREDIPAIIEEIIDHYGLITEVSKNIFAFSHLTFQEFFAANYITENRLFRNSNFDFDFSSYWEEVFILCASILHDATDYLNAILVTKNKSPENLLLAGLCLSVDPVIDKDLKKRIVRSVLNLYHNSESNDIRQKAKYVLTRIDDTFVGQEILISLGVDKRFFEKQKEVLLDWNKQN
jgi:predicted NACHT family NTPase